MLRKRIAAGEATPQLTGQVTLLAFAERWLTQIVEKTRKDATPVVRSLRRDIYPTLGHKRMASVTRDDVRDLIFKRRDLGRPAAAAGMRHLLKRLFDYAVALGVVDANPVLAIPIKYVTQQKSRSRTLNQSELQTFFAHLPALGPRYAAAVELILLTVCRKGELLGARWKHIDFANRTWEVPAELSKTGVPHIVYLSRQAEALFRGLWPGDLSAMREARRVDPDEFVFQHQSSRTQPMPAATLNKAVRRVKWGIPAFTLHDLRRTGATLLSEQGYSPDWIEKALNHSLKGIRGVYNRAQYAEQRKQMLQEWADYLEGLK